MALVAAQSLIMIPVANACQECDLQFNDDMGACTEGMDAAQADCAMRPPIDQDQCYSDAGWAFTQCAASAGASCNCC